jgi:predicted YcjX-like family ATPase
LAGPSPRWPDSTRAISELRLSLRLRPTGWLAGMAGLRTVHVDIIDYPGEWVLDLGLLAQDFGQWSAQVLARVQNRPQAGAYLRQLATITPESPHDEAVAQTLAAAFAGYLQQARDAGFYDCTPGRFLLPGELQGSPVLTFAPLPSVAKAPRKSLWVEMERRFEAYKAQVVRPFFRQHFAKIDRQVVLVDALGAINSGPAALEDLRQAMGQTLSAFRPGRNGVLTPLLGGKRVEKILFAATKADHLHHTQHPQLSAIMHALTKEARLRADFAGAETTALALAAWRATTEDSLQHNGQTLPCVRGRLQSTGKMAALYPGALPDDPGQLLAPAQQGAAKWLDHDYQVMAFAPPVLALQPGEGPPHIRLDRAAQFLIGDKL